MARILLAGAGLLLILGCAEAKVNCVNPGPRQPKKCCRASSTAIGHWEVVQENHDTCECNADWTHSECTCRGIVFKTLCHHCMVNLPASNRMRKDFEFDELYQRCEDCVEKCEAKQVPSMCTEFFAAWKDEKYSAGSMKDVLCSREQLSQVLHSESYPAVMKNALYRRYTSAEDDRGEYWMDSRWNVPEAPSHEAVRMARKKDQYKRGSGFRAKMKKLQEANR